MADKLCRFVIGKRLNLGLIILYFLGIITCESPPTKFERNNPKDPESAIFTPNAPSDFWINADNGNVILTWIDNSHFEDGYLIEKSIGGSYIEQARLRSNTTSYVDSSQMFGLDTRYKITAYKVNGDSLNRIMTESVRVHLGNVSSLNINYNANGEFNLTWNDESDLEHGYLVELHLSSESKYKTLAVLPPNSESYTDPGEGLNYINNRNYKVSPFVSIDAYRAAFDSVKNIFKPASYFIPENVKFEFISETQASISWEDNIPFNTGFEVDRRYYDYRHDFIPIASLPSNTKQYTDSVISNHRSTQYRVRAIDNTSQSDYSLSSWRDLGLSRTVLSFVPDESTNSINLKWDHESDLIQEYILERSTGYDTVFTEIGRFEPNIKSYEDQNVDGANERYQYRIRTLITLYSLPMAVYYSSIYRMVRSFQTHEAGITALQYNHDGNLLAAGYWNKNALLWNPNNGTPVHELPDTRLTTSFAFHPNKEWVATGAHNYAQAKIWDTRTGNLLYRFGENIHSLDFSSSGDLIATVGSAGGVELWETETRNIIREMSEPHIPYGGRSIDIDPDDTLIAATEWNRYIYIYRLSTGAFLHRYDTCSLPTYIEFSYDGEVIAHSSGCYITYFHDPLSGATLRKIKGWYPKFNPNGNEYTTITGGKIRVWDFSTGHLTGFFSTSSSNDRTAYSPDGQKIAVGHGTGRISIWEPTGEKQWQRY